MDTVTTRQPCAVRTNQSARLELKWWTWAATVVRPGPPGCEAWTALSPPIVDVKPVLDRRVER